MSDIQTLLQRFSIPSVGVTQGNEVSPLVDGVEYFTAVKQEIEKLKSGSDLDERFFYIAGWALDSGFKFPAGTTDQKMLLSELHALHRKGVDVRVFVWLSPESNFWGQYGFGMVPYMGGPSLLFVKNMVNMGMRKNVVMNTLSHTMGAAHMKCVVCGHSDDVVAFVGGLDFASNRVAAQGHAQRPWHDAGVRVRGAGALDAYHFYRQLWNEQIDEDVFEATLWHGGVTTPETELKSHVAGSNGTPKIVDPGRGTASGGACHVQVLRTFPNYAEQPPLGKSIWRNLADLAQRERDQPAFTALDDPPGLYDYQEAVEKAIGTAEHYVYIEDQWLWGGDGLGYLNARIKQKPDLKVILVHGGDPADPSMSKQLTVDGINNVLCDGLSASQLKQIAFWSCRGTIHSKLVIVDDVWAVVGSNNFADRSFYTDIELGVAVLEDADPPFAKRLRSQLWHEHSDQSATSVDGWQAEIAMWSGDWGTPPFVPAARFRPMALPFTRFVARGAIVEADKGDTLLDARRREPLLHLPLPDEIDGGVLRVEGDRNAYRITEVRDFKIGIQPALQVEPPSTAAFRAVPPGGWGVDEPDPDDAKYRAKYERLNFNSKEGL